eukprot:7840121-Pyramimonas_sp.AAC.1
MSMPTLRVPPFFSEGASPRLSSHLGGEKKRGRLHRSCRVSCPLKVSRARTRPRCGVSRWRPV